MLKEAIGTYYLYYVAAKVLFQILKVHAWINK